MNATQPDSPTADNWRAPTIEPEETTLFDEPGRLLTHDGSPVDYCAYHFRVTQHRFGPYRLHVKHGGGQEVWPLCFAPELPAALGKMEPDDRFRFLHLLMQTNHKTAEHTAQRLTAQWQQAAAEKRIRTRKLPGQPRVKVWIEPAPVPSIEVSTL